jgi:N-acyl-D-aspartate/D-glutamate deacylase
MYDILVLNGTIVDGTGGKRFVADLGIVNGKIAAIGKLAGEKAARVLDASGKVVTPGFIDPHSHADDAIMIWPENEGCVMQGVTTFVGGNCGFSAAPLGDQIELRIGLDKLFADGKQTYYTEMLNIVDREEAVLRAREQWGLDLDYRSLSEFFEKLNQRGFSTNYYPLVGHGNIRRIAMHNDCLREATPEEITAMKELLRYELEMGARGLSTGLDYPPGAYASTEELLELASVLKEYGAIYSSHVRGRKLFTTGEGGFALEQGVQEAIEVGKVGVRTHISHLTPIDSVGRTRKIMEGAILDGVDISFDSIANTTGGGYTMCHLASILRPWFLAAGTIEQFRKNLDDPDYVVSMKKDMQSSRWFYANYQAFPQITGAIRITKCADETYEGKTMAEIMAENSWSYEDALIRVISADPMTRIKYGNPAKPEEYEELRKMLALPWAIPCSDGGAVNADTSYGLEAPLDKLPHQNSYCYAVKYLKSFSPDSLEVAIWKATGYAAERFGIESRGVLKVGSWADVVIMDMESLDTNESELDTRRFPKGIDYVLVNGVITAAHGQHTGAKAGRVLTRK